MRNVKNYWRPHFGEKLLAELTRSDLREFSVTLTAKGLATQTRSHILNAGTVAIRWAYTNEMIPTNPAENVSKYSIQRRERGILSSNEARRLFTLQWDDNRHRVANLVAMTTGLRAGEIAALRLMDIGDEYLSVNHSWSEQDKLKSTKTGDTRKVPLVPQVRDALLTVTNQNPHEVNPTSFVFWSLRESDRPMAARGFSDALREMLVRLTLTADERTEPAKVKKAQSDWKERAVTFHSWRHFYSTNLADRIDKRKAMLATGLRTGVVFDVYSNHKNAETLREVSNAVRSAFRLRLDP